MEFVGISAKNRLVFSINQFRMTRVNAKICHSQKH